MEAELVKLEMHWWWCKWQVFHWGTEY